jgi:hypothetical protein
VSHLDTAFKLGAAQAQQDFDAELKKVADLPDRPPAGMVPPKGPPGPTIGTGKIIPGPMKPPAPPAPLQPRPGMGQVIPQ